MSSVTTTWPSLPPYLVVVLGPGMLFAAASANTTSFEYTVFALVVAFVVFTFSHLAMLVVRRRHGLIVEGVHQGFYVCPAQSVDDLVTTGSPEKIGAPPSKFNAKATDKTDVSLPRHESMVTPSLTKTWDDSCAIINEAAPHFSADYQLIEMFDFFHNPLEARVFAVIYAVSRISLSALVLNTVRATTQVLFPLAPPVAGIVIYIVLAMLVREVTVFSSRPNALRIIQGILVTGAVVALLHRGFTSGWVTDPFDHRRFPLGQGDYAWYYRIFLACALAMEEHGSLIPYFIATRRPKVQGDPIETFSNSVNFSGPNTRRMFDGLIAIFGVRFLGTLFFVIVGYLVVPTFHGGIPITVHLAKEMSEEGNNTSLPWYCLVLFSAFGDLGGQVDKARQATVALHYSLTRDIKAPDRAPLLFVVAILAVTVFLEEYCVDVVVQVFRICGLFCSVVAPFVVLRCSRMCVRRLGVPRRLDDALRVPPLVRRVCLTIGTGALLMAIAAAWGWFDSR